MSSNGSAAPCAKRVRGNPTALRSCCASCRHRRGRRRGGCAVDRAAEGLARRATSRASTPRPRCSARRRSRRPASLSGRDATQSRSDPRDRAVAREPLTPLAAELKWLARLLGPVRDLDVLIERLRGDVLELDDDRAAGEAARRHARGAARAFARQRCSRRSGRSGTSSCSNLFESAVSDLAEASSTVPAGEIAGASSRARPAAEQLAPDPTDSELHALRIDAKRARYAAELVATGAASKPLLRYLDALKELQDVVGEHQDAVVAETTLRKLARAQTALAAGRLIDRERLRRAEQRDRYPAALDDGARPWAKSVRLMPLLLVRHAWAGDRNKWEGDDRVRPLDERGRSDASRPRRAARAVPDRSDPDEPRSALRRDRRAAGRRTRARARASGRAQRGAAVDRGKRARPFAGRS